MTRRLVIVGAGGFGRELLAWVATSPRWTTEHQVEEIVAIDDHASDVGFPVEVMSSIKEFAPSLSDIGICAIGDPETRHRLVTELQLRGLNFPKFIHDSVLIGNNVRIAEGTVICPNTVLTSDIKVGAHVQINCACTIGHDVSIGEFATLSSSCNLAGGVRVGRLAFLGTASTVIPGKIVGDGSYVGAGSVVIRSVEAMTRVFGNPATRIQGVQ